MKDTLRHLRSLIAPITMCFVLPYFIVAYERQSSLAPWTAAAIFPRIMGLLVTAAGFILLTTTIRLFIQIGNGTIMPWDPARKLIVAGLYRHVRNPMILSIVIVQIGEALLFASTGITILVVAFFIINTLYFIFSEEPGLERRFGAEYREYKANVPRWLPRIKPWRPQ